MVKKNNAGQDSYTKLIFRKYHINITKTIIYLHTLRKILALSKQIEHEYIFTTTKCMRIAIVHILYIFIIIFSRSQNDSFKVNTLFSISINVFGNMYIF
jgi:hypothetical protein